MAAAAQIQLDIWSDYVCPFCYLELPIIERLKAELGRALQVEWHPFELRPEPVRPLDPGGKYLLETWTNSVYPLAAQRKMTLRMPSVQPRSRKAFEAAYFAREQGLFDHMHHALFKAFFEDGKDIGSISALVHIGRGVGLEADALQEALESNRFKPQVLQEEVVAAAYGVNAVPILTARRYDERLTNARALSGAVDYPRVRELVASLQHG
ncbi:MAG TPA: DsbA family protein [Usitatibacter sp.]|nr:DsbA family protein [Usitatibacter sp.]